MCVITRRRNTRSSYVQLLLTILSLYQVDVQTKHAQNEKHFNSTKRNEIQRRIEAIYSYWYYNMLSSPADIEQTNAREYTTAKFKALATTHRLEMMTTLEIIQTLQTLL